MCAIIGPIPQTVPSDYDFAGFLPACANFWLSCSRLSLALAGVT